MSYVPELQLAAAGRYRTVYADPPWLERGGGQCKRGADRHYSLMPTRDICALPVARLAGADAHLYLWVTNNFLRDGFAVCEAWGFRFVTMITWAKDKQGLGQYFRGQTEHCIFAVRGSLPYKLNEAGGRMQSSTLLVAGRGVHSRKPHAMYEVIERVSYGPMLEMFGRNERHGWDCWGSGEPEQRALAMPSFAGFDEVEQVS
jgi:N6-adenosine-specific RNA methylase IME4